MHGSEGSGADPPETAVVGGRGANDEVRDADAHPTFPRNSPPAPLSCCARVWSRAGSRRLRSTRSRTLAGAHGTPSGLQSALCACAHVCRTTSVLRQPASQHSRALRARKRTPLGPMTLCSERRLYRRSDSDYIQYLQVSCTRPVGVGPSAWLASETGAKCYSGHIS